MTKFICASYAYRIINTLGRRYTRVWGLRHTCRTPETVLSPRSLMNTLLKLNQLLVFLKAVFEGIAHSPRANFTRSNGSASVELATWSILWMYDDDRIQGEAESPIGKDVSDGSILKQHPRKDGTTRHIYRYLTYIDSAEVAWAWAKHCNLLIFSD